MVSSARQLASFFGELAAKGGAMFGEELEVDASYFGDHRKGKRGHGAGGKIPVFGLPGRLKCDFDVAHRR